MTCSDCGKDHSDLVELWPVGSKVKSIRVIPCGDWPGIQIGTTGHVKEYTKDGRPLVYFGKDGYHSFHHPEAFLVLSGYRLIDHLDHNYLIFCDNGNERVGYIFDKELGQRIVNFLNSEAK